MGKKKSLQSYIGYLIKTIREREGLTQAVFAKMLDTSQPAIARMEKGEQNFTTKELERISETLGERLITVAPRVDDFEVIGGKKLSGTVTTHYSKNGALALMATSLLNQKPTTLHGIPRIEEVFRFIEVFESIDIKVTWLEDHVLKITPPEEFKIADIDEKIAGGIRVNLYLIPALAHKMKEFRLPNPGGCKMGERTISAHRYALEKLGIKIKSEAKHYLVKHTALKPADIVLYEASDMAAVNTIMAAALIPGKTIIRFAPPNYQVQDVCFFLQHLGVRIEGIGSTTLTVYGVEYINEEVEWYNSEDPIESMFFLAAGIVTGSSITIKRCPIEFLRLEMLKLEKMGLKYTMSKIYKGQNGHVDLVDISIKESKLKALPDKIHALPYPGINNDNLPFFVPIAAVAKGTTLIHDWTWENRAIYFTELNRLGAKVLLADPHRVYVEGNNEMRGAQIVCPPALRPATIILITMLAAEGKSILRNVYAINRGYEGLIERLSELGADVKQTNSIQ
jgi:UDP-N-acetylglucosamine 1-carboxyvinyltransferase